MDEKEKFEELSQIIEKAGKEASVLEAKLRELREEKQALCERHGLNSLKELEEKAARMKEKINATANKILARAEELGLSGGKATEELE